ncbi:MAG: MmgE/PrpD family protein [Desulfobacterales bacterium]
MGKTNQGMTRTLAEFIVNTRVSDIPDPVFEHAKVAFMDWLGVTLAGKDQPLVDKLLRYCDTLGGNEQATILGRGMKKSVTQVALINGAASHALDYDDTLSAFIGHPTVTLFPGLLALSQWQGKSGAELLAAYLIGIKVGVTIGISAGSGHYAAGYHATCTIGCLASAAACSRLLELDMQQTVYALGIGGTQSAGLKQVFGTMCKPFHAGRASEVGVTAALLAQDGFTSAEDILEGASGFFSALGGEVNERALETLGKTWHMETLAQKYHASCHGTHSALEAAREIFADHHVSMDDVRAIRVITSDVAVGAAFRNEAATGLEGKFCIAYCVINALMREGTGLEAFTDERVMDPEIQENMRKVTVVTDQEITGMAARVEVETVGGDVFETFSDIFSQIPELEEKKTRIRAKFKDVTSSYLSDERSDDIADVISRLESVEDMADFIERL